MGIQKKNKKKIGVAISYSNLDKIDKIIKDNQEESRSSVIDTTLTWSLAEVKELLKEPVKLKKELLKRELADLEKMEEATT